jgi:hypothetical protein
MRNGQHCADLDGDRALGEKAERTFCELGLGYGRSYTRHQLARQGAAVAQSGVKVYTLPDITLWTGRGEHHEVKHKEPTRSGWFGLELYRLTALLWFRHEQKAPVFYTVHNHLLAGGRDRPMDQIAHWMAVDVADLAGTSVHEAWCSSYVNGRRQDAVWTLFWPTTLWFPLTDLWEGRVFYGVDGQRLSEEEALYPGDDLGCDYYLAG